MSVHHLHSIREEGRGGTVLLGLESQPILESATMCLPGMELQSSEEAANALNQ